MDAHSFFRIAGELAVLLDGARLEKIHSPQPGVCVFSLFVHEKKMRLVLRHERQFPLLFLTARSLPNPQRPSGHTMRLRKHCAGRRLGRGTVDFASRCLAFPVLVFSGLPDRRLLLDMTAGPDVIFALSPEFGVPPIWPLAPGDAALVDSLCGIPWRKERQGPWRQYAVLTPLLRETLAALRPPEGHALLTELERKGAGGGLFAYSDKSGNPAFCSAWPLPRAVLARRGLAPLLARPVEEREGGNTGGEDFFGGHFGKAGEGGADGAFPVDAAPGLSGGNMVSARAEGDSLEQKPDCELPALTCANLAGEKSFFAEWETRAHVEREKQERRESKRLLRLLAALDQEEERLQGLLAMREDAKALQAVLWQYPADARSAVVSVSGPQGERELRLDPRFSLRENMTRMFRQSARGARGLAILARRRREAQESVALPDREEGLKARGSAEQTAGQSAENRKMERSGEGETAGWGEERTACLEHDRPALKECRNHGRGDKGETGMRGGLLSEQPLGKPLKDVARFVSSDGFVLLRGKNALGNRSLLKTGSPHDLWLHAENSPSAHLIIRRSHAAEEVPERTLREAAALVGEKSPLRDSAKVQVTVALLGHVHGIKGGRPGAVRVDKKLRSLTVSMPRSSKAAD